MEHSIGGKIVLENAVLQRALNLNALADAAFQLFRRVAAVNRRVPALAKCKRRRAFLKRTLFAVRHAHAFRA